VRSSTQLRKLIVQAFQSTAVLFAFALVVRWIAIRSSPIFLPDPRDHLLFGGEAGRIARALVTGRGYADPFIGLSGPTAWLGPVYPLIVAAAFKLLGTYSVAAGIAILAVNGVFAAATCVTMRAIGLLTFGETAGVISAWLYAALPFEMAWASRWVWDTSLSTLLLVMLVWLTLQLERSDERRWWWFYGLLWGVIVLTNGSLASLLPVSAAYLIVKRKTVRTAQLLVVTIVVACVIAMPWWIRNWQAFHKFIPLRSNFAMELYLGNHEGTEGLNMFWDHPFWNEAEMERYRQRGEIAYLDEKGELARTWIRSHPTEFARLSLKRVVTFWADVPEPDRAGRSRLFDWHHALIFTVSLLAWAGALVGWRRGVHGADLCVWVLAVYPLVYYVTHTHLRYRAPIEPVMMLCGVWLVTGALRVNAAQVEQGRGSHRVELATRE
jgi:4-amino-4-deoxy-L-arabinose transferase-like glycosyltransferase